jgi:uncharacterized protein (TIGR02453 family)
MQELVFSRETFIFLRELANNNDRNWFTDNRQRYEDAVRTPALTFIEAMAPALTAISPHFEASAGKTGGSLMRVYRDTRFSKDKTPYKTNIGIHFRHEAGRDVHAPGYYVHVSNESIFIGAGIWHPDSASLAKIRKAIDEDIKGWLEARDDAGFRQFFELSGEVLKRAPQGYAQDHPLIVDLRRKDFIGICELSASDVKDNRLVDLSAQRFAAATPFMRFLCKALRVSF